MTSRIARLLKRRLLESPRQLVDHDNNPSESQEVLVATRSQTFRIHQSVIPTFISSLLALSSGAYMALALVGRALNWPGISARRR